MRTELDRKLEERVKSDLTPLNMEDRYREMIDECYSFESVGGIFQHMQPSRVLEEMDNTAYRCGFNDYLDGEDVTEFDGQYYDAKEVEDLRDELEAKED